MIPADVVLAHGAQHLGPGRAVSSLVLARNRRKATFETSASSIPAVSSAKKGLFQIAHDHSDKIG